MPSLTRRFMGAFLKSLWGHAADKAAELIFGVGPFVAILVRNGFSAHRIVEGRYESGAILFTSFSALLVYHACRGAYDVSKEIAERDKQYGFTTSESAIRFAAAKLLGIVLSIVILLGIGNTAAWKVVAHRIERRLSPPGVPQTTKQSRLEITNIVGVHLQKRGTLTKGFAFNIFYENKGAIASTAMAHRTALIVSDDLLSPEEEKRQKNIAASGPLPPNLGDEIQPGDHPKHYFTAPQDDSSMENLEADAQLCEDNKKRIYLFVVMKYRDVPLPKNEIRVTEFCGWFLGTFEMWHNCGNKVYTQPE